MDKEEREKILKEYEHTRDIIFLQKRLGHKNIKSTFALLENYLGKRRLQT
jgi:hypothetical protein